MSVQIQKIKLVIANDPKEQNIFSIDMDNRTRIIDIKNKIVSETGVPRRMIEMSISGRILRDHSTISECNIQEEDLIRVCLSVFGGKPIHE